MLLEADGTDDNDDNGGEVLEGTNLPTVTYIDWGAVAELVEIGLMLSTMRDVGTVP